MLDINFNSSYSATSGARGTAKINGGVAKMNSKISAWVSVYERTSGLLIDKVKSSADGNYEFRDLSTRHRFFIIAHDPDQQFNAVIQDNVVPK